MATQHTGSFNDDQSAKAISMAAQQLLDGIEDVVVAVLQRAQDGDMVAAKLILDRLLPLPRDRHISFSLRPISGVEDAIAASADMLVD
jgi:hypothetical protein